MKLTKFEVKNYRSINDSNLIDIEPLTVLVGRNESGKSSILQALYKVNPTYGENYDIEKEWPRGNRMEASLSKDVCVAYFNIEDEELEELRKIFDDDDIIVTEIKYHKKYKDGYIFYNKDRYLYYGLAFLRTFFDTYLESYSESMTSQTIENLAFARRMLTSNPSFPIELLLKTATTQAKDDAKELKSVENAKEFLENFVTEAKKYRKVEATASEYLISRMPKFIFMDEYSTFRGKANITEVHRRKKENLLSGEDKTFLTILSLAGIDLDYEIESLDLQDRSQRQLNIDDASKRLTKLLSNRWSQRKYEVQFRIDGEHFYTFVKDELDNNLIDLEERSKGFQWFFSFDLTLAEGTKSDFQNSVILLDEPGLYLHPDAQIDMVKRLEEYSTTNTIMYSTHLPFMIDLDHPERIRVVREGPEGTKVDYDILGGGGDSKFVLQSALGMNYAKSHLVSQRNIVVEGVHDYWLISAFDNLLIRLNMDSLPSDALITPSASARHAVTLTTFMIGQKLNVVCILDSDNEGNECKSDLVNKWLVRISDKRAAVIQINDILSTSGLNTVEDLLPESIYTNAVKELYEALLRQSGVKRIIFPSSQQPILKKIEGYLSTHGITNFKKGSVMLKIRDQINSIQSMEGNEEIVGIAERTITAIRTKLLTQE